MGPTPKYSWKFSTAHGTFSGIDHILGHKSSLGKFKKIEIIPSIFSDHNAVRLDHIVVRKDTWNDLNFFEFTKARFMAQDVNYHGEGSMSTWENMEAEQQAAE